MSIESRRGRRLDAEYKMHSLDQLSCTLRGHADDKLAGPSKASCSSCRGDDFGIE